MKLLDFFSGLGIVRSSLKRSLNWLLTQWKTLFDFVDFGRWKIIETFLDFIENH